MCWSFNSHEVLYEFGAAAPPLSWCATNLEWASVWWKVFEIPQELAISCLNHPSLRRYPCCLKHTQAWREKSCCYSKTTTLPLTLQTLVIQMSVRTTTFCTWPLLIWTPVPKRCISNHTSFRCITYFGTDCTHIIWAGTKTIGSQRRSWAKVIVLGSSLYRFTWFCIACQATAIDLEIHFHSSPHRQ